MLEKRMKELEICRQMISERENESGRENTILQLKASEKRILEDINFYRN